MAKALTCMLGIGFAAAAACWFGCAARQTNSLSWSNHSRATSFESLAVLRSVASDPTAAQTDRAQAVYQLFATYIRPGQSAAEVRAVLSDAAWLREAKLYRSGYGSGFRPVEGDSIFDLILFPGREGADR
jgi:hypothetical protein